MFSGAHKDESPNSRQVTIACAAYALCSSTLLLINKMCVVYMPVPSFIMLVQLIATVFVVLLLKFMGYIEVDELEWSKVKPYLVYIAAFAVGISCNMKALEASNVETVIVFRSCSPIIVSLLDYLFLGRELPSARSFGALVLIGVGAALYVLSDAEFMMNGLSAYSWTFLYLFVICFEMTYGKKIIKDIEMKSMWGPVFYTNILSVPVIFLFFLGSGDYVILENVDLSSQTNLIMLALSCVIAVGISYAGWNARNLVSATLYTLLGVMNKVVTIILNILLWDKHASTAGLCSLFICLVGGFFYQQAPMKASKTLSIV